jgi:hypothetical protein
MRPQISPLRPGQPVFLMVVVVCAVLTANVWKAVLLLLVTAATYAFTALYFTHETLAHPRYRASAARLLAFTNR